MRSIFLFLSRQRHLRRWVETSRLAQRLSARFVAGPTLDDALRVGRRINNEGIVLTLDHLGESVTSLGEAAQARDVYLRALTAIHEHGVRGNVSLKLTQFGLDLSADACRANVAQLVERAASLTGFVRIDMESSEYTDRTLGLVEDLYAQYGSVGTVIQAYLYRSRKDIERLCARRIRVRLCKGAYLEPASVAFARKADVDRNYLDLMRLLLDQSDQPAIATHDERIIDQTKAYAARKGIGRDRFEFQMLYGIRRDLQRRLVAEGYRLRLYVPFGKTWYPYLMRRLAERPANLFFLARHFFRQ
ncbi:MAG: proline dehydrogenase family protein [Acidobacteriota bacterium]|nr:proline dehydrogenase family protein [Acidobacteriota bacterium]